MANRWLTTAEKKRLCELAAATTPFREICEAIGRDRWTTRRNINYLARRPPPEPKRSPLRLSLAEREEISSRAPSTVSRDIALNGGARRYRAVSADRGALRWARRPKAAMHGEL
jgi:IS30 family transposase